MKMSPLKKMARGWAALVTGVAMLAAGRAGTAAPADNFGFQRPINPAWLPHDARQWQGYARSTLVTDLAQAQPAAAVAAGPRQKGKWHVLPFQTAAFSGQALSIYPNTNPAPVRLALPATGWHAVYVGLATVPRNSDRNYEGNSVLLKLGSARTYLRLANNMKPVFPQRDVIQEQLLTVANLGANETLELRALPLYAVTLTHVRLVPLTEGERAAWQPEVAQPAHRTAIATNDGHSWIWPYCPRTAEDLRPPFESFERSDFDQWWFCPLGADLACYPTKVGTVASGEATDFFSPPYDEFQRSVLALLQNGVNPLTVARAVVKEQGREFHFVVRPEAFGASMPYEETFASKFYQAHPEWRCVDREGRQAMYLSYAEPGVRQHTLAFIREAVEMCDPDGVGFFFNRGIPLMLWEKAFQARFRAEYGLDVMTVPAEDPRIHRLRGKIMTEYLRELRAMLDELGRARGNKRYKISAATFTQKAFNDRFGLDIETWVREGLVDQLAVASATVYDQENLPPNMDYYLKVVAGTGVKVYPFPVAWDLTLWNPSGRLEDFCQSVVKWYDAGVPGIAVWDPDNGSGFTRNPTEGTSMDLLRYIGHRDLLAYWSAHGVPKSNLFPLLKLGDNEYSEWLPNRGY